MDWVLPVQSLLDGVKRYETIEQPRYQPYFVIRGLERLLLIANS